MIDLNRDTNRFDQNDEVSLKELIVKLTNWYRYLFSKKWIIIIIGFSGAVLGFLYANSKKAIYTAETTFVLEDEKGGSGLGSLTGLASMAGVDLGGSGGGIFQGDNILNLYNSRAMIKKTLLTEVVINGKRQLLLDKYIEFNKLREKWDKEKELKNISFDNNSSTYSRLQDSILIGIVDQINKNSLVVGKPDKKLSLIKAEVKSENEDFAKSFNDQIVKNVNDFYIQTKTKKSLDNIKILQGKTDSVRSVMNGSIYSAVAVADATPNLNPTRQTKRVAPMQKAQFSAETNRAILATLVQNLEMSKMALLKETPLIQVVDEPILPLKKEKFGRIKGTVLGGFLFGFLTVVFFTIKKILKAIVQ